MTESRLFQAQWVVLVGKQGYKVRLGSVLGRVLYAKQRHLDVIP